MRATDARPCLGEPFGDVPNNVYHFGTDRRRAYLKMMYHFGTSRIMCTILGQTEEGCPGLSVPFWDRPKQDVPNNCRFFVAYTPSCRFSRPRPRIFNCPSSPS